jgi:cyclic beta-1,2-glucan synthetase
VTGTAESACALAVSAGVAGRDIPWRHGEAPYAIEVEIPSGCQRGALWVELVGKRLDGKAISLERERMKNRVVARWGNR